MKNIELPRKVLVGDNAIYEIDDLVEELGLKGKPLIICDRTTKGVAGDIVASELDHKPTILDNSIDAELEVLKRKVVSGNLAYVVGVGGGRIIDAGKITAFEAKKPFISVPTTASHDGIASPQASIKRDKPISLQVHCPLGVVADTKIISNSPKKLLASGCADAISNYTAVLDWNLAKKERNEYYGDYASALSMMSAMIVMEYSKKIMDNISVLIEALLSSGVAIGIAGSSRPCSGAEHMFSHALDMICDKPALHGEQCGVGTIIMAYMHDADWVRVRDSLRNCGAPTTAKQLGIPKEKIIEALTMAHTVRDRYTILRGGISQTKAREIASATGVL